MTAGYCITLTVTDSEEAAGALAGSIISARLAACVQISSPIRSVYRWQGAVEDATEWQLWCKTTNEQYEALVAHIVAHHSYDVPEVIRLPIEAGHAAYLRWIDEETTSAPV